MIYLATKYSDPDPLVQEYNYGLARTMAYRLMSEKGLHVYSPILHYHDMATHHALPTSAKYWQLINQFSIDLCEAVYVYRSFGWQNSIGVRKEIEYARQIEIPVYFVDVNPDTNALEVSQ